MVATSIGDRLASYFGGGGGHSIGNAVPSQHQPPIGGILLNQESRYPSLPLLSQGGIAESGPASVETPTGGGGRSDDMVAFSLPSSPLYGGRGGGLTASVSHPPHAFMPITPAQGSPQSASVIVAPTPLVLLPSFTASNPLVISPPQQPAASVNPTDTAAPYFSPVMSPGILNTAFAPANPLFFASGLPAVAPSAPPPPLGGPETNDGNPVGDVV